MAQVHPFHAYRYNASRVSYDRVLTQPYDKISPAMQEKYYAADPHNLIAIEKGRVLPDDAPQHNVYTRAEEALESWLRENIVLRDTASSFYGYTQEYTVPGTEQRRVDAILEEAEAAAPPATELRDEYGVVHRLWVVWQPERVAAIWEAMAGQKLVIADGHHRYETSLTYRNERRKERSAAAGQSSGATTSAGSRSSASREGASSDCASIDAAPGELAPYEFAMMTFVNTRSEGLTILPTHRVVANVPDFSWPGMRRYLEPWFAAETFPFQDESGKAEARERFLRRLVEARDLRAIGVYPTAESGKRAFYVLTLRGGANLPLLLPGVSPLQRELDVVLLHEGILEPALGITPQAVTVEKNLTYEREAGVALDAVDLGAAQVAFLLNPCDVEQVVRIATSGEVMPQKSTDFYPKLLSGITMYRVDC